MYDRLDVRGYWWNGHLHCELCTRDAAQTGELHPAAAVFGPDQHWTDFGQGRLLDARGDAVLMVYHFEPVGQEHRCRRCWKPLVEEHSCDT